ncbi:MAG: alpha/beta hydrolase [Herminiimonas sp.]|nr:alpha/beta hydrolase [Herminiimonas sp.]
MWITLIARTVKTVRLLGMTGIATLSAVIPSEPAYARQPDTDADAAYVHPQQLVDIGGGRKLNLYCIGSGEPTVIFDSGLSDWGFTWALVQPVVAMRQRACVYDRAGLGYSDPGQRPATSSNIVDDLHALLTAARIDPPYLLVGHSFGGMNMRLYADRYRNEVAGMVLLDPTHEDGIARIDAARHGQESRRYRKQVSHWRDCLRRSTQPLTEAFRRTCLEPADPRYSTALNAARDQVAAQPTYQRAQLSEVENYANGVSFAAVRQARRNYGSLPLIVLTSGKTAAVVGVQWTRLHQELAGFSSVGMQRTIADGGHYLQLDRPDLVIEAIAAVGALQARPSH